jgi:hypothetical protein
MIFLISTLEPMRIDGLPSWIAHYRALGVERFLLTLQTEPDLPEADRDRERTRFASVLASQGIAARNFLVAGFTATALREHQDALQREHVSPRDWVIWVDSDEYQLYPAPLADLASWAEKQGVNLFRGVMIDRVAADGELPARDERISIWQQYPIACFLPTRLGGGERQKITFARGDLKLSNGNHYVRAGMLAQTIGKWTQVHHFKWDRTVRERLAFRLLPAFRAHSPNWQESQRALDYFDAHDGRFDRDDLRALDLPARDFIDWVGGGRQTEITAPVGVRSGAVFSLQPTSVVQGQRRSRF